MSALITEVYSSNQFRPNCTSRDLSIHYLSMNFHGHIAKKLLLKSFKPCSLISCVPASNEGTCVNKFFSLLLGRIVIYALHKFLTYESMLWLNWKYMIKTSLIPAWLALLDQNHKSYLILLNLRYFEWSPIHNLLRSSHNVLRCWLLNFTSFVLLKIIHCNPHPRHRVHMLDLLSSEAPPSPSTQCT